MAETQAKNFIYRRELEDGREIVVYPMLFTDRLCVGVTGDWGYDRAWCYPKGGLASRAAEVWDGEEDPEFERAWRCAVEDGRNLYDEGDARYNPSGLFVAEDSEDDP